VEVEPMKKLLSACLFALACLSIPAVSQAGTDSAYVCTVMQIGNNTIRMNIYTDYGCQGTFKGQLFVYDESLPDANTFKFKHDVFMQLFSKLVDNRWSKIVFDTQPGIQGVQGIGFITQ
jgi:hypothetical protein